LEPDVYNSLSELYQGILSGKLIPPNFDLYLSRIRVYTYFNNPKLDWRTIKEYAQEEAAYDYLYSHIKYLLSNPDEYIQHMKIGDLGAFSRESREYTPS